MTENEHYQQMIRRAVEDPDFRERLIEDPAGTWEAVTGTPVPDDIQLIVLENSRRTLHLVLPDPHLTVQDLDEAGVAGGWTREQANSRLNADMRFCCADFSHVVCDSAQAENFW